MQSNDGNHETILLSLQLHLLKFQKLYWIENAKIVKKKLIIRAAPTFEEFS